MTAPISPSTFQSSGPAALIAAGSKASLPRLVLVALGSNDAPSGPAQLLPAVASRLERLTGLATCPIANPERPASALAELLGQPGGWLAPLPLDPGLPLDDGSWAEALGAWRQTTVLMVEAPQLATGLPAAATALLERWGVPLVGLIQWGGPWDGERRRRDGLPWLGWLDPLKVEPQAGPCPTEQEGMLLAALEARWRRLIEQLA